MDNAKAKEEQKVEQARQRSGREEDSARREFGMVFRVGGLAGWWSGHGC